MSNPPTSPPPRLVEPTKGHPNIMKQYFILAAASVLFHTKEGEVGNHTVNVMVRQDTQDIGLASISRINHGAAMTIAGKIGEGVTVDDIAIVGIMHLGYMTEEEFLADVPEEVAAQMRTPEPTQDELDADALIDKIKEAAAEGNVVDFRDPKTTIN